MEQKTFCEQALIIKEKEFGGAHPEVVKLNGQLADLKSKVDKQVDGILLGLDQRASALNEQLAKLTYEVEKAKEADIASARKARPYIEAKRNLGEAERFSQVLATKIASEKIEAAVPKSMKVEIMDSAMVPLVPVYPNRTQAAAMIVLGILLDLGGLRMIRTRHRLLTPVLQPS
jgi:uncharacterized protein involved in exopolysaccharide biosynthesis